VTWSLRARTVAREETSIDRPQQSKQPVIAKQRFRWNEYARADFLNFPIYLQSVYIHSNKRVVRKIRFPRSCSREERCYAGSGDTGV
jgi:hypothetical protein